LTIAGPSCGNQTRKRTRRAQLWESNPQKDSPGAGRRCPRRENNSRRRNGYNRKCESVRGILCVGGSYRRRLCFLASVSPPDRLRDT